MHQDKQLIWVPGRAMGKARPRTNKRTGTIHLPADYRAWRDTVALAIRKQATDYAPIPCKVSCTFINFFSSDADNLVGSFLDVMVRVGYLQGDSSRYVQSQSGIFQNANPRNIVGTMIAVEKADYSRKALSSQILELINSCI